jgi:RecA/RadA recombinase
MSNLRGRNLINFRNQVNKKCGDRTMDIASRLQPLPCPRITTGSLSFDYIMGGGIPVGHISLFHGGESSGKTTHATRCAGYAQKVCANCYRPVRGGLELYEDVDEETGEVVWAQRGHCDCVAAGIYTPVKGENETIPEFNARCKLYDVNSYEEARVAYLDNEGTFDNDWARKLGCNPDLLLLIRPQTAEETVDLHDELVRTGSVDFIILDSIAAMTPKDEITASATEWQQGLAARIVNKFARKTNSSRHAVRSDFDRPITEIWINQERVKMNVQFGDPTVLPSGSGQRFAASVTVKMWASKWEKETLDLDLKKAWQLEIGTDVLMSFKATKNKTWRSQGQGGFKMSVAGETAGHVLDIDYMVAQAEKFALLRKEDKGWQLGDEKYRTKAEAIARMQEPSVRTAMRATLVKRMIAQS